LRPVATAWARCTSQTRPLSRSLSVPAVSRRWPECFQPAMWHGLVAASVGKKCLARSAPGRETSLRLQATLCDVVLSQVARRRARAIHPTAWEWRAEWRGSAAGEALSGVKSPCGRALRRRGSCLSPATRSGKPALSIWP